MAAACLVPSSPRRQGSLHRQRLRPMCQQAVRPLRANHFPRAAAGRRRSPRRGRRPRRLAHQRHRRRRRLLRFQLPPRLPRPRGGWPRPVPLTGLRPLRPRILGWLPSPPHNQATPAGPGRRSVGPSSSARHDRAHSSAPCSDASIRGSKHRLGIRPRRFELALRQPRMVVLDKRRDCHLARAAIALQSRTPYAGTAAHRHRLMRMA
jgi:hypothetical protein